MSARVAWLRLISALALLLQDAIRFLLLGTRSSAALKAENLFLRKQLALYLERKAKPRRADDVCVANCYSTPGSTIRPLTKKRPKASAEAKAAG